MIRLKIFISLLLFSFLFLTGCINDPENSHQNGIYNYTAYDSLGTIVSKGRLLVEIKDSLNITGNWEIDKVGNPGNIGPQHGKGILDGNFVDGNLVIGLNPNFADNNIVLDGKVEADIYSGKWYYSSFIGLTNWGWFEAIKE